VLPSVLLWNQTKGLCNEASILDVTFNIGFTDRVAEAILGMGVAVIVDVGALDVVGFPVNPNSEVASFSLET
jgi:hypothetical protein